MSPSTNRFVASMPAILMVWALALSSTEAFTANRNSNAASRQSTSNLFAGRGMAAAAPSKKKKKKGKKKATSAFGNNSGAAKSAQSFDVGASVSRLEKKYDTLLLDFAKQVAREDKETTASESIWDEEVVGNTATTTATATPTEIGEFHASEYVVAAKSSKAAVSDWIPIAQICLARRTDLEESAAFKTAAVSTYCRELYHVATLGAPIFKTIPRNDIQYSIEPIEEFHKYVYGAVIEGAADDDASDDCMTKTQAREVLGLESESPDKSEVKSAYRKLAFELHSDRFEGTEEECAAAAERFGKVKTAYETLSSGVREEGKSWYASLGGRARNSFLGPIELANIAESKAMLEKMGIDSAVIGVDRDLVQSFVTRNLRSK